MRIDNVAVAKELIRLGANGSNGALLHIKTSGEMIKLLAGSGADIEAPGNGGNTPLLSQISHGNLDGVRVLLALKAKVYEIMSFRLMLILL